MYINQNYLIKHKISQYIDKYYTPFVVWNFIYNILGNATIDYPYYSIVKPCLTIQVKMNKIWPRYKKKWNQKYLKGREWA